ncbi:camphor resistance protein CrcB [Pacificitalea manganoxidans]|uniref:Camphor resistance protein CrcB n=1 Tax=Pacificitalea manganoxidans TaxID=1411902 RepID=A0A291LWY3_9RHOB|nr:DUF302 domain-containing protein [Pacificitalea manganoxidans]MAQ47147.1 DUF302 domain-containing protein [Actibacterium sp.]OWU69269.1 camphor resistance protein CrcB [Roseovarius sp. 22II1-1F6A]ATI41202.1 camphor resistance protein CrcB [Pacificitalea manganoxidans]MBF53608.1 DUF302 domain-containing protein [Actibacterium sp.]MDR6308586.1 uncharacterized protein (DUF302 family) [Pacificitalea manganoxidans]|tara:strand:- start:14 stop:472 length:459 start_codon:yes stop_codon:yes gene_type:complete
MTRFTRPLAAAIALLGLTAGAASADIERLKAEGSVAETIDRLEQAVEGAGATIFARVDHAGGAASVDMELADAELLIFGNPQLGTPAMQADPLAGLALPLRVLAYADAEGQTWIAYEEPEEMFDDLDIDDDAPFVEKMEDALEKLTKAASGM